MLKAVFFDIDDTLYSTHEFAATARRNALEAMRSLGLAVPMAVLTRELDEVIEEFSSNYDHHFEKLLTRLPAGAYKGINPAILVAGAVKAYHDTKFAQLRPYPDVLDCLKVLTRTNLIRGIITDGLTVKQAEKLLRLGIYPFLTPSAVFISDQIGISKPNPKLFQRACEAIGVSPRRCMYVGNSLAKDIAPAARVGMITVLAKRGARRDAENVRADYEIAGFGDLLDILRQDFRIKISDR